MVSRLRNMTLLRKVVFLNIGEARVNEEVSINILTYFEFNFWCKLNENKNMQNHIYLINHLDFRMRVSFYQEAMEIFFSRGLFKNDIKILDQRAFVSLVRFFE